MISIAGLTKAINVAYAKATLDFTKMGTVIYDDAYTVIQSTKAFETYKWLGELPVMREWKDEKTISGLFDRQYIVTNKNWEATLGIDRNTLEDDEVGVIMPKIQTLSMEALRHKNRLISQLVINGTSNLAYDGQAFFANRAINDNLMAGTGTSSAQIVTDLTTARATMWKFTDDAGEPFQFPLDTVICPPELETTFRQIIQSTTAITATASGVINPFSGIVKKLIVDPRLTDPNDWYGICGMMPVKPFVYQERSAPKLVTLDKDTDPQVFMRRKILYSVETRGNAGYSFYQFGIKVVN